MENIEYPNQIITSETVKAKCYLEDESLYFHEYINLVSEGYILLSIIHCEMRNISKYTYYKDDKIILNIQFDIVFTYEYCDVNKTKFLYSHQSSRINKDICIDKDRYEFFSSERNLRHMKCSNNIKNIKYIYDIDPTLTKVVICINVSIESFLLCEENLMINIESKSYISFHEYKKSIKTYDKLAQEGSIVLENEYTLKDDVYKLENICSNIFSHIYNTRNFNNLLRKELERKKEHINSYHQSFEVLNNCLNEKEIQLNEMKEELNIKDKIIRELNYITKISEKNLHTSVNKNNELLKQIDDLNKQVEDLNKQIDYLSEQINLLTAEINNSSNLAKSKRPLIHKIKSLFL